MSAERMPSGQHGHRVSPIMVQAHIRRLVPVEMTPSGQRRSIPAEVGSTVPYLPITRSHPTEHPTLPSATADESGGLNGLESDPTLPR